MEPQKQTTTTPKVIAEIGCNHRGDIDCAFEMIRIAAQFSQVHVVKFQKRNNRELLSPETYSAKHPNQNHAYGDTYGEHREALEFNLDQHRRLKECCSEWGVTYSTSVWDCTSAREIVTLNPTLIKVPSASNLNFEMLGILADSYQGEIHLSFGMTSHSEEEKIVSFFDSRNRAADLVIYSCTSGYPVDFQDVCLFEISRLTSKFGRKVKSIGFSGHHLGVAVDIAALTLGATWFERHFTLDRTWKGTDHAASLEPDGMRRLVRDLKAVQLSLSYKTDEILPVEQEQRMKLKQSR